jgi:hypothetical protein
MRAVKKFLLGKYNLRKKTDLEVKLPNNQTGVTCRASKKFQRQVKKGKFLKIFKKRFLLKNYFKSVENFVETFDKNI